MINPFSYLLELIGLKKTENLQSITFAQLEIFELSEKTSEAEIRKIIEDAPDDVQFHLGIPYEFNYPECDCVLALIQRVPKNDKYFLICKTQPYGMTKWEKKYIDHIVKLIMENRNNQCTKLELWKLAKRAVEGKRFGEY